MSEWVAASHRCFIFSPCHLQRHLFSFLPLYKWMNDSKGKGSKNGLCLSTSCRIFIRQDSELCAEENVTGQTCFCVYL